MDAFNGVDYKPYYDVDDKHPPRMAVTIWLRDDTAKASTPLTFLVNDESLDYLSDKLKEAFQDLRTLLKQYVWPELKREAVPA